MNAVSATDTSLPVLRVGLGAVFVAHGYNHMLGGGKIAGTARWFESLGSPGGRGRRTGRSRSVSASPTAQESIATAAQIGLLTRCLLALQLLIGHANGGRCGRCAPRFGLRTLLGNQGSNCGTAGHSLRNRAAHA